MKMTFGYELELGDILRTRKIPEHLGAWEYAETDIVNLYGGAKHIAVDPLGKEPNMGGEINIKPGHTPKEVAQRVMETIEWFQAQGDTPSASCVNHGHVHVRVKGLRDDIRALKRLTHWVVANQDLLISKLYGYIELPGMSKTRTARTYLKWDGGRPMPSWMAENITKNVRNFDDFITIQCCGKDGVSRGRPFRYAVNTYCLKHTDTVEFRCFRASLDYAEILGSIQLAEACVRAALDSGPSFLQLLHSKKYVWPPFYYDHASYVGWETTKWPKERGQKKRTLYEI